MSRLILDVSTIVRWVGPPVGIARAEHALASYARRQRPDVVLSFFDPATARFRGLHPDWAARVLDWSGAIDTVGLDYRRHRRWWRNWLAFRHPLVMALERRRLTTLSRTAARAIGRMQRLVLAARGHKFPFADARGNRITMAPFDLAVGPPLALERTDVLLSAGSDWFHKDIDAIARLKQQASFRYVVVCYDIIPLLHPEFFPTDDVARFRRHWTAAFPLADRIIFTAHRIAADARDFCARLGIDLGEAAVIPLGYDPPPAATGAKGTLPDGLEDGRFALFVSTIEPRKGHALLLRVWRRLLAAGVPQPHRFKLAFAGRRGWHVEALLRAIDQFGDTLVHVSDASNAELARLYQGAAFCLYPSLYEGFGLPVIEAFAHGKAVIASSGGALPEAVGDLSPCLDPQDEDAWEATLRQWIEDPQARAAYEARIHTTFTWPTWDETAQRMFDTALHVGRDPHPGPLPEGDWAARTPSPSGRGPG